MINNIGDRNTGPKGGTAWKPAFSIAERVGFGAFALAMSIYPIYPGLVVAPLAAFLLLCFIAPLIPGVSFFLPIISRGPKNTQAVAVTFDDGPDPNSTLNILDLLEKHHAYATFFVTGEKAERYPAIIKEILKRGHTIGNHTLSHDNFIMLKSSRALMREIEKTQQVLVTFGITPLAFRPPVGVTSPRLEKVLRDIGMYAVNFSRRAGDRGNRRVKSISKRILRGLEAGDIIMLHDTPPHNEAHTRCWLNEVDRVLIGIKEKGLNICTLSKLIDHPVMIWVGNKANMRQTPEVEQHYSLRVH